VEHSGSHFIITNVAIFSSFSFPLFYLFTFQTKFSIQWINESVYDFNVFHVLFCFLFII
jgi:hypothetical protein